MSLIDEAQELFDEGFNPLPLRKDKAPMLEKGHNFLYSKMDNIESRFANAEKIGIACGEVSGGFYGIDFDCHKGQDIKTVYENFIQIPFINMLIKGGFFSCYSTMSGGFHIYFLYDKEILKGKVLSKYSDASTMIEIRGNGQYLCCYPSEGYNYLCGVEFIKIKQIESPDLVTNILDLCSSFTLSPLKTASINESTNNKWGESWTTSTPEGRYNLECGEEARDLIAEFGWQYNFTRTDGVEYWTRPNKSIKDGSSATWGFQKNLFYIFTSDEESIKPFETNGRYSPFNIFTLLKHNGDWKKSKDELKKRFGMENNDIFWSASQDGRLSLNNYRFKNFLQSYQLFKHSPNEKSTFDFVQKDGIFLKIVYEKDIKDFVLKWIEENEIDESVYNLMTGNLKFFKREYLSLMDTKVINPMKDDAENCYLYYKNCIVKINKKGRTMMSYEDAKLSIWKGQVIERNYIESDHHKSEYRTFIWKISGENVEKYKAFQSVIGYLLHSYKTNSNNKAIIFNDEIISDSPNGRSGKGLFWNALKKLKKVSSLDGKSFDFNKSFPYQSVSTDCQILVFDDVKKNFQFENLFSVITEGITIEYKGKDSINLGVKDSPKIIITTNYTIKGDSASFIDRMYEVEMSSYFSDKHSPIDEFGHELFNDWSDEEWARFDNYMMECITIYLKKGLIKMPTFNLAYRKLVTQIGNEMINFCDSLERNEYYKTKDLFDRFIGMYPERRNFTTQNKITANIKYYCKFKELNCLNPTTGGISKIMLEDTKHIKEENEEEILPF
jgi:hypothetical protein